ncbi:MAG: NAD-dependent epimerase/dehydratase family protein [Bacteroidales bacterium]|nr:NAD-dependent epimerase/dehydratase family protein [Bacteroidales bacterium]
MGKVLVTGANGFLASHTIDALTDAGYDVRGTVRTGRKARQEGNSHVEIIRGDFTDPGFMDTALSGCDMVVHCAAMTSQGGKAEEYMEVNVNAAERLIVAAIRHGVRKIVLVGSANAFAYGTMEAPGDESRPTKAPFTSSAYAVSKAMAQGLIPKYHSRIGIVAVSPTFMIGPSDGKSGSGRVIGMGLGKKIIFCPPGGKNFVDVRDAARGIVAALSGDFCGSAYLLAGENMSYREFYRTLCRCTGQKSCIVVIPRFLLYAAGCLGSLAAALGFKNEATLTSMRMLCTGNYYTGQKAVKELGISFREITDSIGDAVKY